jgi:hypothetical protein
MSRQAWIMSIAELFVRQTAGRRSTRGSRRLAVDRACRERMLEQLESRCVLAAPDAPFGLLPVSGNEQVTLSWTAPVDDGGFTITDYLVQYREAAGPADQWTPYEDGVSDQTNALVAGLMNGTAYVFQVAAVNQDAPEGGPYSADSPQATPAGLPFAPTDVVAEAGDGEVVLTWTVPDGNGAAITSYMVEITNNDTQEVTTAAFVADAIGDTQVVTVTNLVNGTPYVFRVAAINGVTVDDQTQGEYSDLTTPPVTPSPLPATPAIESAVPTGATGELGMVQLVWTDLQADDLLISSYVLEYRPEGGEWQSVDVEIVTNSYTVVGLEDGVAYTFRVAAKTIFNRQGEFSDESSPVTPSPLPGAPSEVIAVAADKQATVSWTDGDGFGVAINYYVIQLSTDGGETWTDYEPDVPVTGTSALIENLANGTAYLFRVATVNIYGRQGEFSDPSEAVTPTGLPDAPADFVAGSGDRSARLTWSVPENTGGLPVIGYSIEYRRIDVVRGVVYEGRWIPVAAQPTQSGDTLALTLTGLVNGVRYEFAVATRVGDGNSEFQSEAASALVMPLVPVSRVVSKAAPGVADAPASVSLGWSVPRLPAGVSVIDYVIQYSSDAGTTWQTYEDGISRANVSRLWLENGNTYVFKVAAVTSVAGFVAQQQGVFSAVSAPVTPFVRKVVADRATGLVGESVGAGVRLSWTAPAINQGGAAVRYVVQYKLDIPNARWIQVTLPASGLTSAVIGRLAAGKSYSFRVAAVNMAGQGAWSDVLSGVLA